MNILIISQHYYPENFRVNDIAETLVKLGHSVHVVCGLPNYPEGIVKKEYKRKKLREQILNGVVVHRSFEIGRRKGIIFRFLNYYSVCLSMKKRAKKLKEKFDFVLVQETSPVMVAWAGIAYAKKFNVPCLLYCYDLWPDCLCVGGIKRGGLIYKHYFNVSKKIYQSADKVFITSKSFAEYLSRNFGVDNTVYLPQYCEDIFENAGYKDTDTFDYTFAGNVGKTQSVDTIIKAAVRVKAEKEIKIHIVGGGSDLDRCQKLAESLGADNVYFYGKRSIEEMPKFYGNSDAMIVTFKKEDVISKTLPGKVQSYMAAGKPIISACGGETPAIIKEANAGLCCDAENDEELAKLFIEMTLSDRKALGENARRYYEHNFRKELFFEKLFNEANSLIESKKR